SRTGISATVHVDADVCCKFGGGTALTEHPERPRMEDVHPSGANRVDVGEHPLAELAHRIRAGAHAQVPEHHGVEGVALRLCRVEARLCETGKPGGHRLVEAEDSADVPTGENVIAAVVEVLDRPAVAIDELGHDRRLR